MSRPAPQRTTAPLPLGILACLAGAELNGDPNLLIEDGAPADIAGPSDLTFATDKKVLKTFDPQQVGGVVTTPDVAQTLPESVNVLICEEPQIRFVELLGLLRPPRLRNEIGIHADASVDETTVIGSGTNVHARAVIGADAVIGENCEIHPGAVIGPGCVVGDDCQIGANAVIGEDCILGNRVILQPSANIGSEGFGYRMVQGKHVPIPQLGRVILEDDVEIGSSTCVDRGAVGDTVIGEGTKIDNLVQIAHNCRIGRHNMLVAHVGIAGSCTTGDYVVMAGQVGIADHVTVGDRAVIGSKTGVMKDLPGDNTYLGSPAEPVKEAMRHMLSTRSIPGMKETLRELTAEVERLRSLIDGPSGSKEAA